MGLGPRRVLRMAACGRSLGLPGGVGKLVPVSAGPVPAGPGGGAEFRAPRRRSCCAAVVAAAASGNGGRGNWAATHARPVHGGRRRRRSTGAVLAGAQWMPAELARQSALARHPAQPPCVA